MNAVVPAVATIERLLAHGQLPGPVLASLQKLLEDEATHPLALISLRGDRAAQEKLNEQVRAGEAGVSALFDSRGSASVLCTLGGPCARTKSRLLEENTRLVEIAKMPAEQQGPAFRRYQDNHARNGTIATSSAGSTSFRSMISSWRLWPRLAVAASRQSEPGHLCAGQRAVSPRPRPLARCARRAGSGLPLFCSLRPVLGRSLALEARRTRFDIYSVGLNGKDDGGVWPRGNPYSYNKDEGFRLDDPKRRDIASPSKP